MPTTRLMQFSPTDRGDETTDDIAKRNGYPLLGVSSAHFLKLIEERGQVGFWTWDFATGKETTSFGLYRLFGVDPSIPFGRDDLMRIMHPDDQPSHHDLEETMRSGHAIDREFRIIRPDGTMRWLQIKAEVIADAEGHPARSVGVITDVTDQYSARQSVKEGWHRYRTLVKSIAVMELRIKANGEPVHWDGWFELTGQTAAQAAGWGWLDVVHPQDREFTRSSSLLSWNAGNMLAVDHRIRCADGQYRLFFARVAPIVDRNGKIREWIGALFSASNDSADHTERPRRDHSTPTLAAPQMRAARALLNWTVLDLANQAGVSVSSISRLEAATGNTVREHVFQAVREAFERHGVSFTSSLGGDVSVHFNGVRQ